MIYNLELEEKEVKEEEEDKEVDKEQKYKKLIFI